MILIGFLKEDFQIMNYNFKFAPDFTDAVVSNLLKTVEDSTAKLFRVLFNPNLSNIYVFLTLKLLLSI